MGQPKHVIFRVIEPQRRVENEAKVSPYNCPSSSRFESGMAIKGG